MLRVCDHVAQGRIADVALADRLVSHQIAFGQVLDDDDGVRHRMGSTELEKSSLKMGLHLLIVSYGLTIFSSKNLYHKLLMNLIVNFYRLLYTL
jgi:hypothetical protein